MRRLLCRLIGLSLLLAAVLVLTACHPNIDITFVNQTEGDVLIAVNDSGFVEVNARTSDTFTFLTNGEDTFEVQVLTEDGVQLLHETFTQGEIKAMENRIVIEQP